MATLQRIRQRSGLLIIIIGLAMLAFILTDLLNSGGSVFRGNQNVVGRVDGSKIEYTEFNTRMDKLRSQIIAQNPQQAQFLSTKQLADGVWDEFLRDEILGGQYADLGFDITSEELYQRIKQNPNVQQAFRDEVTGGFSDANFSQYISQLESQRATNEQAATAYQQWLDFEQAIKKTAINTKYNQAIQKGLYVPQAMAKVAYAQGNTNSTIQYIALPYSSISDSAVSVTDGDLKSYYNSHKEDYESDGEASLSFVSFTVAASTEDKAEIKAELDGFLKSSTEKNFEGGIDTVPSFANAENDSAFAAGRSDLPVSNSYIREDAISPALDSSFFVQDKGYVYGPYEEGSYYKLSKVTDVKNLPDSVNARHILLSFAGANNGQSQSQRSFQDAQALADSLLGVLKTDSTQFTTLAQQYSEDPGSGAKGGNLGWFTDGAMVPSFNTYCFQNESGDIGLVFSQFGFHIIQILDQGGSSRAIQVTTIAREISPSDKTLDNIYNDASQFASNASSAENFNSIAEENGYTPRPVAGVAPFDESVSGIGQNREIVRWMYNTEETEVGDIQLFNNNNNSYIVAKLTGRSEDGYRSFESVKNEIKSEVIKEKKAEQLMEKAKDAKSSNSDFNALASALGTQAKSQGVNLNTAVLTGSGREPKVMGVASVLEVNSISEPVKGNMGVYIIKVTNRVPSEELPTYASEQQRLQNAIRPQVSTQIFTSLKDGSDVMDNRARFF